MSSNLDRVDAFEFSLSCRDLAEEFEEVGVVRPDERISDVFADEFSLYCEHFIDYFPKAEYHFKTTYDSSSRFCGWPQRKSRRTGKPIRLFDTDNWKHRTDQVERHLDHEQWRAFHEYHGTDHQRPSEFFWLALGMPKKTRFHAIDADNKGRIGWYGEGTPENPLLPVMSMPLEHFTFLKAIYDAFPNRIWCITSETLGLDIIQKHTLQISSVVHDRTKRQLKRIGYGSTEVHPMAGRCKRRPFGEHYRTITCDGVLTTWQNQLEHYVNPGDTPSFRHISLTLLAAQEDQLSSWLNDRHHERNRGTDILATVGKQRAIARNVLKWLDDDCPPLERAMVVVKHSSLPSLGPKRKTSDDVSRSHAFDSSLLRSGNWANKLEDIARNGLPADDSVGQVVFEMAKWLWWIELFDVPEPERRERVLGLLKTFVFSKHNGYVSRINQGHDLAVIEQITRCLNSAIELRVANPGKSKRLFERLRSKRKLGQYRRLILLEPLLLGQHARTSSTPYSSPLSTYISVCGLPRLDCPLPSPILDMIAKKKGRNKIEAYATRMVNFLAESGKGNHFLFVPRDELCKRFLGYVDPNRLTKYNKILKLAGVIDTEPYRAKSRPTGYRLTNTARSIMEQSKAGQNEQSST